MRKFIIASALAAGISVSGCATTGTDPNVSATQNLAVTICGFLPTIETVAAIFATGNPLLQTASAVAQAICSAVVPPKSARLRAVVPQVNGITIQGQFVNRGSFVR